MKVIYYARSAESHLHIHAGSYANCFFIPDRQVVLVREQQGTFGGIVYSICDDKWLLEEALVLTKGIELEKEGARYSKIKEFEYDNSQLDSLIEDAKLNKGLEKKVKDGIERLLKNVEEKHEGGEEERFEMIDLASLDERTKKRLEDIVEDIITYPAIKGGIYCWLESDRAEIVTIRALDEKFREDLKNYKSGKVGFSQGVLSSSMKRAREAGLDEIAKEFAEMVYSKRSGEDYDDKLVAAEILGRTEEEKLKIKEDKLLDIMSGYYENLEDYQKNIKRNSEGIPLENIRKLAESGYQSLIGSRNSDADEHFRAAFLAKNYLGEKEFHKVGKILVEKLADDRHRVANWYSIYGKGLIKIGFPDDMVRPLMLKRFEIILQYNINEANEIRGRYHIEENEMRDAVNEAHEALLSRGQFEAILKLRKSYGHLVENLKVENNDIRMLAGLHKYFWEGPKRYQ